MSGDTIGLLVFGYIIGIVVTMIGHMMFTDPYSGIDGKTLLSRIAFWPIFIVTLFIIGAIHISKQSYADIKEAINGK